MRLSIVFILLLIISSCGSSETPSNNSIFEIDRVELTEVTDSTHIGSHLSTQRIPMFLFQTDSLKKDSSHLKGLNDKIKETCGVLMEPFEKMAKSKINEKNLLFKQSIKANGIHMDSFSTCVAFSNHINKPNQEGSSTQWTFLNVHTITGEEITPIQFQSDEELLKALTQKLKEDWDPRASIKEGAIDFIKTNKHIGRKGDDLKIFLPASQVQSAPFEGQLYSISDGELTL